jgi:hypothetical protein
MDEIYSNIFNTIHVLDVLCPNVRKTVGRSLIRHCSYVHKFVWLAFLQCEDLCHSTSRFGNPITGIRQIRTNWVTFHTTSH